MLKYLFPINVYNYYVAIKNFKFLDVFLFSSELLDGNNVYPLIEAAMTW
jgi:hypothetical protein